MRLTVAESPAPLGLLATVVVVGAGLGWRLAGELATAGYRLEEEQRRPRTRDDLGSGRSPRCCGVCWLGESAESPAVWSYLRSCSLPGPGVALAWIDLDVHRLPEGLTLPVIVALLVLLAAAAAVTGQWGAFGRALLCGVSA